MVDEPKSNMAAQLLNGRSKPEGLPVVGAGASAGGVGALEKFVTSSNLTVEWRSW
jgi:chemotaxis response regulator CheB